MHSLVFLLGFESDSYLGNSLIILHNSFGTMKAARLLFNEMENKDLVTWNSLIYGFVQNDGVKEAVRLFNKMPGKDAVSWTTMISGFPGDGDVEKSIQRFRVVPFKDDIAWTAMIFSFVSIELHEDALCWFRRMLSQSIEPNPLTLSSVLSAAAGLATLNQGMQIHAVLHKMCFEHVLSVQNSLISMYSKCGNMWDA
ncbi:hypothetical protein MLD38_034139 [Melastoma candidum]|uniref:Uncharacterized protein n=1 Tax=Melastoma candidum TaxID=119954 RepID=A0ACB9MAD6_9MYRT|nr:hypothetical protein MLD38_034139 [Melastoma candidum]